MADTIFKDKVLLITGGTGSFGNAVLESFLDSDLKEIRIFSRDEKKQHDMRIQLNASKVKFIIGDVRSYNSIYSAMYGVDFVFHAAALKQVPSCEFYPLEAVKTNVLGTENVLNASIERGVKRVICLSTDKAVYPVNAMGISKAMMEKVLVAKSRVVNEQQTVICGTRYGNVLASRGSVIPLFVQQLKDGKPLTITNPDMTRFLMPLMKAIDLVMFAFHHANEGDIFVQKTPACTIKDLATALQQIFNVDNGIKIIGTRHGEKQHEALLSKEEKYRSKDLGDYYQIPADGRDLNYDKFFEKGEASLSMSEDYSSDNSGLLSIDEIKKMLLDLDFIQQELKEWK